MGVFIGVGDESSLMPALDEPTLMLEDDGYYWFLHPLLEELRMGTGEYVDLVGDASFLGEQLLSLRTMLRKARNLVEAQPRSWDVCTGQTLVPWNKKTHSRPHLEPVFFTVDRRRFLALLDQWDQIIARAEELRRPVVCLGD